MTVRFGGIALCAAVLAAHSLPPDALCADDGARPSATTRPFLVAGVPTPTLPAVPDGFLCTAGARDGLECLADEDCPGGACVIPLGVCETGLREGNGFCICPGAECTATPACDDYTDLGTCNGGVFAALCCEVIFNCDDGSNCIPTQKLCAGGELKGFPCLRDADCVASYCESSGGYCDGGDNESFACYDEDDCPDGECVFPGATPTPRPTPSCTGDCNDDDVVTVDELLTGVAIILLQAHVGACPNFDVDGNRSITIDELIQGVQSILQGCAPAPASSLRAEDK